MSRCRPRPSAYGARCTPPTGERPRSVAQYRLDLGQQLGRGGHHLPHRRLDVPARRGLDCCHVSSDRHPLRLSKCGSASTHTSARGANEFMRQVPFCRPGIESISRTFGITCRSVRRCAARGLFCRRRFDNPAPSTGCSIFAVFSPHRPCRHPETLCNTCENQGLCIFSPFPE